MTWRAISISARPLPASDDGDALGGGNTAARRRRPPPLPTAVRITWYVTVPPPLAAAVSALGFTQCRAREGAVRQGLTLVHF